jgi:PIN domain nuclease of toxin-antitoxin system
MRKLFVCDTNAIIWFFSNVFQTADKLSARARCLIEQGCSQNGSDIRLSIPSVVFIEIFDKWCVDEVSARRIHNEVFRRLSESPNVEIRPIDLEVIACVATIAGRLVDHEMHDKMVLASAMVLECPLITSDGEIAKFNESERVIPEVFT